MRKPGIKRSGVKADERIGYTRTVAELLPRVGRKAFRRFGFVESAIVARWAEIVGPEFARQSSPESIRFPQGKRSGGTLTLAAHGAFALSIQHAEPLILERVNRFFGYAAVARLAIRQGARPAPREEARERPKRALDSRERAELRIIEDDALRESLADLAARIGITRGPPKIG